VAHPNTVDAGEQRVRLLCYQAVRYLELVVKEVESLQQFFVVCKKSHTHAVSRSQVGCMDVGESKKSMIIQLGVNEEKSGGCHRSSFLNDSRHACAARVQSSHQGCAPVLSAINMGNWKLFMC